MRFCDFFLEYQYAIKDVKSTIPWVKLPFYRKLCVVLDFLFVIGAIISCLLSSVKLVFIFLFLLIVLIIFFTLIDSNKKNIRKMLDTNYLPYSEARMKKLFIVLDKFNLKTSDRDRLELLIEEAKMAQIKSNPFISLRNPIKVLGTIIIPIIAFVVQKVAETKSNDELITLTIIYLIIAICVFSIILAIIPLLNDLLNRDSKYYDDLIYDIRQIIIFYKDESKTSKKH